MQTNIIFIFERKPKIEARRNFSIVQFCLCLLYLFHVPLLGIWNKRH